MIIVVGAIFMLVLEARIKSVFNHFGDLRLC